jgi:hypothetical protein
MKMKIFFVLVLCISFSSCAFFNKTLRKDKALSSGATVITYNLTDKSGKFELVRETGFIKSKNQYITKRQIFSKDENRKLLEKSIVISTPGSFKGVNILRPKISQYSVWFEKKKYFSEMSISTKEKSMMIKLNSPEKQWRGESLIKFPKITGVFCYFSQIIECANLSGFIDEATKRQAGNMKVLIIWEGFPYIQEQYLNIPKEVFLNATFAYDGKNQNNERRFTLKFAGQSVFYFVDKKNRLLKMFWVSQGLSVTRKN